jgi:stage III sporulation protein AF
MQYIIEWTNCIICVTVLFTIVELVIPEGNQKKTILMVTGIMTTIAIATPVIELFSQGYELSEVFNINEIITNLDMPEDEILNKQIEELEETYAHNILISFNERYPATKLDECKVYFSKDKYGKILGIDKIVVITQRSNEKMKERLSEIAEIDEDKISILVMPNS